MDLVARAPPAWINAMAGMGNGGNAYVSALGVFGSFYGPIGTSLGLVSAIIGLITASKANQPKEHWGGTIVRMQAGLDQPPGYGFPVVSNAGGDVPVMIGFNFRGEYVGDSKRIDAANANYLHEGAFTDINIPHVEDKKTQQVPLLQVLAGDNAVCVAYLGVVWADDTKLGWLGDMGYWCGGEWSYSKIIVGEDDGDKKRVPMCMWLDGKVSGTLDPRKTPGAVQIDMTRFMNTSATEEYEKPYNPNQVCQAMRMMAHAPYRKLKSSKLQKEAYVWDKANFDFQLPNGIPPPIEKRSAEEDRLRRREAISEKNPKHLVTTAKKVYSPVMACDHPRYRGPDLLSKSHGVFCEASTKTLWQVCDSDDKKGNSTAPAKDCFDPAGPSIRSGGLSYLRTYSYTETW